MDPTLAIDKVRRELGEPSVLALRKGINRWRSVQKLYQDCGWGTERYDGEELERRAREWFGKWEDLEKQSRFARGGTAAQMEDIRETMEAFMAESAGANAV